MKKPIIQLSLEVKGSYPNGKNGTWHTTAFHDDLNTACNILIDNLCAIQDEMDGCEIGKEVIVYTWLTGKKGTIHTITFKQAEKFAAKVGEK